MKIACHSRGGPTGRADTIYLKFLANKGKFLPARTVYKTEPKMNPHGHCNTIHDVQDVETNKMSFHR